MANKTIQAVVIDQAQTFVGAPLFQQVDQKTKRADKDNFNSPEMPVPGKWVVTLSVRVYVTDNNGDNVIGPDGKPKTERVEFKVTVAADRMPCQGMNEFEPVQIERLVYNMMVNDRTNKAMAFYRAKSVRAAGAVAGVNGQK